MRAKSHPLNSNRRKVINANSIRVWIGGRMIFITLARWKKKPTQLIAQSEELFGQLVKEGNKILSVYWTLGTYDAVVITEEKDVQTHMKSAMRWSDLLSTETLVAVTREEGIKLIE